MAYKIIYLFPSLNRQGPTYQLFNLLKKLDRNCFTPLLIILSKEVTNSLWKDFEALDISMQRLNMSRVGSLITGYYTLKKIVDKIGPSIIHSQGLRCDILASKSLVKSYPILTTARCFLQDEFVRQWGKLKGRLYLTYYLRQLKLFDSVVGVSEAVSQNLLNAFGISTMIIRNGVDNDIYRPATSFKKKQTLRKKLGISQTSRLFVSSGLLSGHKNPLLIINAFKSFACKKDILVFLGDGPLRRKCQLESGEEKKIHFLGKVDNVAEYLQAADYYISASLSEGFPNSVLEAIACGLPCILSDIPSHKEIHILNPDGTELFQSCCIEDLIKCFHRICMKPYIKMQEKCIIATNQHFCASKMARDYQSLYINMVNSIIK